MNAQPMQVSEKGAKLTDSTVPSQRRLIGLVLFEATRFNHSDTIVSKGSGMQLGQETSIVPARILASGDWAACVDKERPDGFGLEQYRGVGKDRKLFRGFVTLAAVKELVFAE